MLDKSNLFAAFSQLSLAELDRRIADLDAERKALSVLRRSLVARDKTKRRHEANPVSLKGGTGA